MSMASEGTGLDLFEFKTEGSGLCSAVQDFCCKPKQVKQPIQSPITPKPSQEPSKPKCSDLPGFQCLSDIEVSNNSCNFVNMFSNVHYFFKGCSENDIVSPITEGSGASLLTFKTETGLCSSITDFCCKPKEGQTETSAAPGELSTGKYNCLCLFKHISMYWLNNNSH